LFRNGDCFKIGVCIKVALILARFSHHTSRFGNFKCDYESSVA
jgi:hypothetical protein